MLTKDITGGVDIGAMDIAQRLELQALPSVGYTVHSHYEASTT